MLTPLKTTQYERDIRRMTKRGKKLDELDKIIGMLAREETLPEQYRDHPLKGKWLGFRECHIEPDWLLVYFINGRKLMLVLARTGSHSDLRF